MPISLNVFVRLFRFFTSFLIHFCILQFCNKSVLSIFPPSPASALLVIRSLILLLAQPRLVLSFKKLFFATQQPAAGRLLNFQATRFRLKLNTAGFCNLRLQRKMTELNSKANCNKKIYPTCLAVIIFVHFVRQPVRRTGSFTPTHKHILVAQTKSTSLSFFFCKIFLFGIHKTHEKSENFQLICLVV